MSALGRVLASPAPQPEPTSDPSSPLSKHYLCIAGVSTQVSEQEGGRVQRRQRSHGPGNSERPLKMLNIAVSFST